MNVSVLKAALKDGRMGGRKREMLIVKRQNRRGGVKVKNNSEEDGRAKLNFQTRRREQRYPAAITIASNNHPTEQHDDV